MVPQTGDLVWIKTKVLPLLVLPVADQTDMHLLELDLGHALQKPALPPPGLDDGGPHLRCPGSPVVGQDHLEEMMVPGQVKRVCFVAKGLLTAPS